MCVRAPKGETQPYYYEKGNTQAIHAYNGVPSSDWPDLYEAEAFNKEYGLYISAPAGSSSKYPSYFGGVYLTKKGIIPFYNVTSKDAIDFTQMVQVSYEDAQGYENKSKVELLCQRGEGENVGGYPVSTHTLSEFTGKVDNLAIKISNISEEIWANLQQIGLNYWGDDKSGFKAGTYYYTINKVDHKLYIEKKDGTLDTSNYAGVWIKDPNSGKYVIILGGGAWALKVDGGTSQSQVGAEISAAFTSIGVSASSTNTASHSNVPLLTLTNLLKNVELGCIVNQSGSGLKWADVCTFVESGGLNGADKILNQEFTYEESGSIIVAKTTDTFVTPQNRFQGITWLLDIKSDTYQVILQKSPSEKITNVKITNIGYDKWKYDFAVPIIYGDLAKLSRKALDKLTFNNEDKLFLNVEASYTGNNPTIPQLGSEKMSLYTYNDKLSDKLEKASDVCSNVGSAYESQMALAYNVFSITDTGTDELQQNLTEGAGAALKIKHKIFYIVSESNFIMMTEDHADYPLVKDGLYNTVAFNVTEEVYPGKQTGGGEFIGSLDPQGKDSYGANIYWPNVLNPDDFSFIETIPVRTFDEDIDDNGIFEYKRIVDDKLLKDVTGALVGKSVKVPIKGQRYVTHIVEKNIKEGTIGGAWRDEFFNVVKEGWDESFDSQFDDVYVFMDPTGQEFVHTIQASLVETHKLAMAISPKIITQATFSNPNKITVTGRHKQCAQYAGEFQYYDPITGKNFWMQPIGDVGLMYCRIIEKKMGGWAPAWYNYNSMGGQLPRAVLKPRWNFSDSATQIMDLKGVNPIVYNADDGLMAVSSKTTQDPNNITDWSEVGHVLAFLLLKREIRDNVMRPQIKKPIDDYWMNVRQAQVDAILAKRISGPNKIWNAAKCEIASVNNATTKAMRKFVIVVTVQVNVFSEYVELVLVNTSQSTQL